MVCALQEHGAPDELAKTIMVEALIHFGQVWTPRRRSSGRLHTSAAVVCVLIVSTADFSSAASGRGGSFLECQPCCSTKWLTERLMCCVNLLQIKEEEELSGQMHASGELSTDRSYM